MTAPEFIAKWRQVELSERSASHERYGPWGYLAAMPYPKRIC